MKIAILFLLVGVGFALHTDVRHVHLKHSSLHTRDEPQFHQDIEHLSYAQKHHHDTKFEWMVHVVAPATLEKKTAIENYLGAKLGNYLPHNSWFLSGSKDLAHQARKAPNVLWVGAYKPQHKIHDDLKHGRSHSHLHYNIMCHNGNTTELAEKWSSEFVTTTGRKAIFSAGDVHIVIAQLSDPVDVPFLAEWVAEQPETHWVERKPTYTFSNKFGVPLTQGGTCQGLTDTPQPAYLNSINTRRLTGKSVVVEINDQGLNENTCYLPNSAGFHPNSVRTQDGPTGHGTAIAGIIAGVAPQAPENESNGMASEAVLLANSIYTSSGETFNIPLPVRTTLDDWYNKGKIGTAQSNVDIMVQAFSSDLFDYSEDVRTIDDWAWSRSNVLMIFPTGNAGDKGSRSISGPGNAKNVLTVGGSLSCTSSLQVGESPAVQNLLSNTQIFNENTVYTYSGRGPTADGRIKPDVIAPATKVFTTDASAACGVKQWNGTSMSAGYAGGAAALVRDYLINQYMNLYNTSSAEEASAAQIKAILINSGVAATGVDIGTGSNGAWGNWHYNVLQTHPNEYGGWGRISLDNTLWFDNEPLDKRMVMDRSFNNAVNPAETLVFCFLCTTNNCRIKVTLVWTDPASDLNTGLNLVQDLDLAVSSRVTGKTWRGNGNLRGGTGNYDSRNNVEQVEFVGGAGLYQISVYGASLPAGPQYFGLVASGDISFAISTIPALASNCPVSLSGSLLFAPNNCSNHGLPQSNGVCTCQTGYFGIDCSAQRCGNDCVIDGERRGTCDYDTSTCVCLPDFAGSDCSTRLAPREAITPCGDAGVSTALLIVGIVVALLVGLLFGGVIGWFIAIKYLENQRKKRRQQLISGGGGPQ